MALRQDERGQTTLEYALLAFVCILVLMTATIELLDAQAHFYTDVTRLICLPLP